MKRRRALFVLAGLLLMYSVVRLLNRELPLLAFPNGRWDGYGSAGLCNFRYEHTAAVEAALKAAAIPNLCNCTAACGICVPQSVRVNAQAVIEADASRQGYQVEWHYDPPLTPVEKVRQWIGF